MGFFDKHKGKKAMTNNTLWSTPVKKINESQPTSGDKFIVKANNPRLIERDTKYGSMRSILVGLYDVCDDLAKKEDVELTVYDRNKREYELIAFWPDGVFVTVEGTYSVNNNSKYKNRISVKKIIDDGVSEIPF